MNLYESIKNNNLKESTNNSEWKEICKAFCKKIGAELLFVNNDSFGYSTKDGQLVHMYADELEKYLKNNKLNEAEETGMTITQYAKNLLDGEMDMDVSDTEIDMLACIVFNFNEEPTDYYDKFIKVLCDKTKVYKLNTSWNSPILVCKFSDTFKPYNEECKDIFDMDYSEFDENEAYYEAVANLDPLISGNAGESTYKDMYDMLIGQYKIQNEEDIKEGEDTISKRVVNLPQMQRYIFNKYRDEFDSLNDVYDLTDKINSLFSEGGMKKVDEEFFLPGAPEDYKNDFKKLIYTIHIGE